MKSNIVRLIWSALFLGLVLISPASAGPLTFFGNDPNVFLTGGSGVFPNALNARAGFLSNLVGVGTESFESFLDGATGPLSLSFPGAGAATLLGSGAIDDDPDLTFGQRAITGSKWWRTSTSNNFSIEFANPVAAFGFFGIDAGETSRLQLTLTSANGSTLNLPVPHPVGFSQNGAVFFYGYIDRDNPWVSVDFTGQGQTEFFGFDDMTIGSVQQVSPVPEPASVGIFAGLGCVLVWRSRRKRKGSPVGCVGTCQS